MIICAGMLASIEFESRNLNSVIRARRTELKFFYLSETWTEFKFRAYIDVSFENRKFSETKGRGVNHEDRSRSKKVSNVVLTHSILRLFFSFRHRPAQLQVFLSCDSRFRIQTRPCICEYGGRDREDVEQTNGGKLTLDKSSWKRSDPEFGPQAQDFHFGSGEIARE
ncbi:hypothetical protein MPTK1_4g04290 [Marchantia polymorpha subsp. ruderalis]|uniref:Uncharacterized protein n=2 Tax=Marchantia polymorpha TaxID=3197 RepID=A0AAF6B693_MARPO|nr:hypothetical protein MARPO_0044s0044 [Marchantia polymorpha]BBN07527.1 hypothetical protein Mp_4g04290 [Marchantia polymorpha subsp. ruderalis]|eukprot:PTQ39573.1 hypothetical protein MARPO_0044s0044 [Marchantia polymorpha]